MRDPPLGQKRIRQGRWRDAPALGKGERRQNQALIGR
jgi:hypothetical protein